MLFRYSNAYEMQRVKFCISLPHPAIFKLTLPAFFSPVARTSPASRPPTIFAEGEKTS